MNEIGDGIQTARSAADQQINQDVINLNSDLKLVADLNERIARLNGSDVDVAALQDQRQAVVDRIALTIPVQEAERQGGQIALFTSGGAVLLDGTKPASFAFAPAFPVTADMSVGAGNLGSLFYNGKPVDPSRMDMFGRGSLAASFTIRDQLAPELQREMDALALDLHDRLADASVDTTLGPGAPALFNDAGIPATVANLPGLSSRLRLNDDVNPMKGGSVRKIRDGLGAVTAGPSGDSALLTRISGSLDRARTMSASDAFAGSAKMETFIAQAEARVATRRVGADSDTSASSARTTTLRTRLMADGVDTDAELSRLLAFEQAYAANAKVIQTVGDMLNAILRM